MLVRFVACFSGFLLTLYLPSSGVQGGTECKTCERPQRPALPHARSPDLLPTLRPFTPPSAASFLHRPLGMVQLLNQQDGLTICLETSTSCLGRADR